MAEQTQELEDDVAEMVCHIALDHVQDLGTSEPIKQQLREALNKLIDERLGALAGKGVATPPRWRKGQKLVRRGDLWLGIVTPSDRNVYVVTRDSWADSSSWVEPIETAKI